MTEKYPNFLLPQKIDGFLSVLSKMYATDGETILQEVVVNAQIRIVEAADVYQDWGKDVCGHSVYLGLPESLYLRIVKAKDEIRERIKTDLNNLHNIHEEYIHSVFLEVINNSDPDWRKKTGLLLSGKRFVLPEIEKRIWGESGYRLFLSHKSEAKVAVAKLKAELSCFGVTCFVAHEDIHPIKEWQTEIENALDSMDALAAILAEDFHDSDWTDQEVGFAFGRGVQILPVKITENPYGFIGKYQALSCNWGTAAKEIVKVLIKQEKMMDAYVNAVRHCPSFESGNKLAEMLPTIERITPQQESDLIDAYNINDQILSSFGFNGGKPHVFGYGLAHHLTRLTKKSYTRLDTGNIVVT